jgi:hypothetical protein
MSVIRKASVFAAVLLGFCVSSARAQGIITVKVPFPFVAGEKKFPAGQYEIRSIDGAASVIAIEGMTDPSSFGFVMTHEADGSDPAGDEPSLVFTRYENQYRLAEIWDSKTEGRELPDFSTQHEARADTQGGLLKAQEFVLAANWK